MSLSVEGLMVGDVLESKGVIRDCGSHSEWVRIKIRKITEDVITYQSSKGTIAHSSIDKLVGRCSIRDDFKIILREKKSIKISELV